MNTLKIDSAEEAAEILRKGGLVAFPTETVFGLGVDATNPDALKRLFEAKGRPNDNPLIVHLADSGDWNLAASKLTMHGKDLLESFSPGPLTVVLPKHSTINELATSGLQTVGVRIPNHNLAQDILRRAGKPIAAPSANLSGLPSGTTWRTVLEDLNGRVDAIVCVDGPKLGIESTVVDCCGKHPVILRQGAVTLGQIQSVAPDARYVDMKKVALESPHGSRALNSPGIRHPHYQPKAEVRLILMQEAGDLADSSVQEIAYCGLNHRPELDAKFQVVFADVDAYAAGFYEFLREADRRNIAVILVEVAPLNGIGGALRDRQLRSAGQPS